MDDERRAMGRRAAPVLLVVQVVLAAAGIGLWRGAASAPPSPTDAATRLPVPTTFERGLAAATERARAWRPEARLLSATMQVDWPWEAPPPVVSAVASGGWLTYVFVAPWSPAGRQAEAASLAILIDRMSGDLVVEESLAWESSSGEAAPADAAVTADAAVLLAEAAGGTAFRRACPIDRHLSRLALVAGGGDPDWLVVYRDEREPGRHGFTVRIDGATSAVLDIGGEPSPCEEIERRDSAPRF